MRIDLAIFDNSWYNPGRGVFTRTVWHFINALFLQSPLNSSSGLKIFLLRVFGAKIGKGVVLKPSINIKYPWNVEVGDHSWIGEGVWLDSLEKIKIGKHCCISQGAYFCTGSHDSSDHAFGLIVKPIIMEDGSWVGARATVLQGVTVKMNSIVSAGSVMSKDTDPEMIYRGNPAEPVKKREIRNLGHTGGAEH